MTKIEPQAITNSGLKVKVEGLVQRAIGSENNGNQLPTHITEPLHMNEQEFFTAATDNLVREKMARAGSYRSMFSPVVSSNDVNTGERT
jgi:hypothetical protein